MRIFVTYHELYIVGCISSHGRPVKLHHGISTGFCSIYQVQVLGCIFHWWPRTSAPVILSIIKRMSLQFRKRFETLLYETRDKSFQQVFLSLTDKIMVAIICYALTGLWSIA